MADPIYHDGAGVEKIYLGGYTPAPKDRFGRAVAEFEKTSLGASSTVAWESILDEDVRGTLGRLKAEGFQIIAIEQDPRAISIYDFTPPDKVCYIFGNEVDGIRSELLNLADQIIEIPMLGQKESLNVAVCVGVVSFK